MLESRWEELTKMGLKSHRLARYRGAIEVVKSTLYRTINVCKMPMFVPLIWSYEEMVFVQVKNKNNNNTYNINDSTSLKITILKPVWVILKNALAKYEMRQCGEANAFMWFILMIFQTFLRVFMCVCNSVWWAKIISVFYVTCVFVRSKIYFCFFFFVLLFLSFAFVLLPLIL